jgi:pilus assembly protein CpaC
MVDEREQQPAAKRDELENEAELLELEECAVADATQAKPAGAAPASASLIEETPLSKGLKRHAWYAGYGALGVAVLALVTVLLAQGLTAALHSTWRVAGITDGPDMRLSVETNIPQANTPEERQRLARIQEVASSERAKWQGTITIAPEGRSYLPPQDRDADIAAANKITIPVSQGRLLKFDEPVEQVFIADPQIADIRVISPLLVYVYGKRLGNTNLLAMSSKGAEGANNGEPRLTGSALLSVVADASVPNEAKHLGAPDSQLDVRIVGNRIMLNGRMRGIDDAVNAASIGETYSQSGQPPINNTTLAGSNQVNIRVRFAEISRNDLKSFGIDWNVGVKAGSFNLNVGRTNLPADTTPNLTLSGGAGNFNVDLLIDALQSNGALTILAEPNLTAVTGETARFLAGGEVPIPVPSTQINEQNKSGLAGLQYKSFGVALSFTPTLVKENRIALRVQPEVSSITSFSNVGFQGFSFPVFKVSRTETTVEMASGQTFALAGLFQRDISTTVDKMPVLGDVPVLGPLFRSERYKRSETELVILITPYLVNPVRDHSLATPLDRVDPMPAPDPTYKGAGYGARETDNSSGFIVR